ncbi:MAG TPA: PDZ domain-containing protein [Flavobacterium sp.]|jgi:hypothetical protein
MKLLMICLLACLLSISGNAQGFRLVSGKSKVVIPFELVNNLIVVPINVNGIELKFLVDSGIEETILFSLDDTEEISFANVEKIKLQGLGGNEYIEALKSFDNIMIVGGLTDIKHEIYIVLNQDFNISEYVGIPINGIIGFKFFRNNLVELDYDRKRITVYKDDKKFRKKLEKQYKSLPISLELQKPYVKLLVYNDEVAVSSKLLVDTGNSDALWLFSEKPDAVKLPAKCLEDFLGRGFSGEIHGKRGRVKKLDLSDFEFTNPIASFPDAASIKNIKMVDKRMGSLGGEILRRFTLVFDYKNRVLYLKKGASFNEPFHYNMSGLEVHHDGLQWVTETVGLKTSLSSATYDVNGKKQDDFQYKFELEPIYRVSHVRPGSPADLVGILKDDVIVSINGLKAFRYTLQEISSLMKSEDGKTIELEIERDGKLLQVQFQLKSLL